MNSTSDIIDELDGIKNNICKKEVKQSKTIEDILQKNIDNAKDFTRKFKSNTYFYVNDSVAFLENFNKKIDFLYLDSFDGHNVELASKHQLNEAMASISKLNNNSLILLDDKGAKTKYSLDFFLDNNFSLIGESNSQILLSKNL